MNMEYRYEDMESGINTFDVQTSKIKPLLVILYKLVSSVSLCLFKRLLITCSIDSILLVSQILIVTNGCHQ